MTMSSAPRDAYASIRQTAARALLESATLDAAVAEILGAISSELDWPLALYWNVGTDDRQLHCRSIWAADTLKRADDRREPVWIESLSAAATPAGTRLGLALSAGLKSSSAFPVADHDGAIG